MLKRAHRVGRILAITAVSGAGKEAQVDQTALGAAHIAVFVAFLERIDRVGHRIVKQQGLRVVVRYAICAQRIALPVEKGLKIRDGFDRLGAVIAIRGNAQKPQVIQAVLQILDFIALGAGLQRLRTCAGKEQRHSEQKRNKALHIHPPYPARPARAWFGFIIAQTAPVWLWKLLKSNEFPQRFAKNRQRPRAGTRGRRRPPAAAIWFLF